MINEYIKREYEVEAKQIPGFPLYFITRDGKVFSNAKNHIIPSLLKPGKSGGRYFVVVLCIKDFNGKVIKKTTKSLHRLIMETWSSKPAGNVEVCHNDGNISNNTLENLRWDTHRNNIADMVKHGTHASMQNRHVPKGEECKGTKLTEEDVKEIRKLGASGMSQRDIARKYGVWHTNIAAILARKSWKHV